LTEERSKPGSIDVVGDGGFQIDLLKRQGILAQYRPPENSALLAGAFDPDGYWSSVLVNTETIAFNPVKLKAGGLKSPVSWQDLALPQWRGQLGLFVGSYEWYAAMKRAFGAKGANDLMRAYAANKPQMLGSKAVGMRMIEAGDILAAPNMYGYEALNAKRRGANVDFVNPAPTIVELYPVAVTSHAPHPNAARLMVRWWLSRETQQWQKDELGRLSSRKDVQNDPELWNAKVRYVVSNPVDSSNYNDDVKAFNAIFAIPE
jgi:iron(III) transport system substrate-binding protein